MNSSEKTYISSEIARVHDKVDMLRETVTKDIESLTKYIDKLNTLSSALQNQYLQISTELKSLQKWQKAEEEARKVTDAETREHRRQLKYLFVGSMLAMFTSVALQVGVSVFSP